MANAGMSLWGRASSVNVQKVLWAMGELGVDVPRIDAGGKYGRVDLKMNPNGRVPVLVEGDLVLWESNAIVRHLCRSTGGELLPGSSQGVALADQWMDFAATTLSPPFIGVFWQMVRFKEEDRDTAELQRQLVVLHSALAIVDAHLEDRAFLLGSKLTMADIPAGCLLYRYFDLPVERPELPHLRRWYDRLTERQAYRNSVMTSYEELRAV